MASLRDIRRRIRSVGNTKQITRAMQMVSAARMRRARVLASATRPFGERLREVLRTVTARVKEYRHPLLYQREGKRAVLILITSDRGLCGALNSNVIRAAQQQMRREAYGGYKIIAIGRKGRDFARRMGIEVLAEVTDLGERPSFASVQPAIEAATGAFLGDRADVVVVAYARYVSAMVQNPQVFNLIPVVPAQAEAAAAGLGDYIYEPDAQSVLDQLLPRYVDSQVFEAVVENLASEHSARMLAMRNATENAAELIERLTLSANKLRQANITKELMEIIGGAEALTQAS